MVKEIKNYLHLYLGCDASIAGHSSIITGTITPSTLDKVLNDKWIVRPILRPLSDMTEEEKDSWVNCFTTYEDSLINDIKLSAVATHYLLSKHFDLFGLIESDLAIDKTKSLVNG